MKIFAKILRVITAPPFVAFALFTCIFLIKPQFLSGTVHYILSVIFFAVFPLLAYPVSMVFKFSREKERKTAVITSIAGYIFAIIFYVSAGAKSQELIICLTYLLTGVVIGICSLFHLKPSGHAGGVSGPVTALTLFLGFPWSVCYLLLLPVYWSSLKIKRHTFFELITGTLIPVFIMIIFRFIIL